MKKKIFALVMAVMMLAENALIAAMVLLLTPFSAILSTVIAKKSAKEYDRLWEEYDKLYTFAEESYGGLETLKSFTMESLRAKEYADIDKKLTAISKKANFLSMLVQPLVALADKDGNLHSALFYNLYGVVRRAAVDEQKLDVAVALRHDALQCRLYHRSCIVCYCYYREFRLVVHCLSFCGCGLLLQQPFL